ncbi:hypothetical protein HY045_03250 [Candidatus Woesebacteria bacterium]|nr:hypothetical protein [Candidatus Woesebacteria bacterium]
MEIKFGVKFTRNEGSGVSGVVTLIEPSSLTSLKVDYCNPNKANRSVWLTKGEKTLLQFNETTDISTLTDVQKSLTAFYLTCLHPFAVDLNDRWESPLFRKSKEMIIEVGGEVGMVIERRGTYSVLEEWGSRLVSAFESDL